MKATTHHSRHLPNKYGGFYIGQKAFFSYLSNMFTKKRQALHGMLLDLKRFNNRKRKYAKNRYKMERTKFAPQLDLQQTIKYGSILYLVVILVTIPAGICSSSHQPLAYEYSAASQDLLTELLKSTFELNHEQMTLALVPGMGVELLSPPEAPNPPPFHGYILQASQAYEVEPALIRAIIMVESSYNPRAVSHRGAQGLMQLMPVTAKWLGVEDAFDPELNIDGGVRYIKQLLDRFEGDLVLALAAYNAGSRYVRKYKGVPPFRATRIYIKKVLRYHQQYQVEMAPSLTSLRMS